MTEPSIGPPNTWLKVGESHELDITTDGRLLAHLSHGLDVWDVSARTQVASLTDIAHPSHLALGHRGHLAAVKSTRGEFGVFDLDARRALRTFRPAATEGAHIAFSPDDACLIDGGWDGAIRLLEVATGQILLQRDYRDCMVTAVTHAAGTDRYAFVVDPKRFPGAAPRFASAALVEWRYPFDRHAPVERETGLWSVSAAALDPRHDRIALGRWHGRGLHTPATSELLLLVPDGTSAPEPLDCSSERIASIAWSPDGQLLGAVARHRVLVLDADTLHVRSQFPCQYARHVTFTADGIHFLVGSWEAGYRIPVSDLPGLVSIS